MSLIEEFYTPLIRVGKWIDFVNSKRSYYLCYSHLGNDSSNYLI